MSDQYRKPHLLSASIVTFAPGHFVAASNRLWFHSFQISVLVPTNMQQQYGERYHGNAPIPKHWAKWGHHHDFLCFSLYFLHISYSQTTTKNRPWNAIFLARGIIVMQDHPQIRVVKCLGSSIEFTPRVTVYHKNYWEVCVKIQMCQENGIEILKHHVNLSNLLLCTAGMMAVQYIEHHWIQWIPGWQFDGHISRYSLIPNVWWHHDHDAKDYTILLVGRIDQYITLLSAAVFVVNDVSIKAAFLIKAHRSYVCFVMK